MSEAKLKGIGSIPQYAMTEFIKPGSLYKMTHYLTEVTPGGTRDCMFKVADIHEALKIMGVAPPKGDVTEKANKLIEFISDKYYEGLLSLPDYFPEGDFIVENANVTFRDCSPKEVGIFDDTVNIGKRIINSIMHEAALVDKTNKEHVLFSPMLINFYNAADVFSKKFQSSIISVLYQLANPFVPEDAIQTQTKTEVSESDAFMAGAV